MPDEQHATTADQPPDGSRKGTRTSSFGFSRREGHDASRFYERFESPVIEDSEEVQGGETPINHLWVGDARDMDACIAAEPGSPVLADNSVALVVTSPPYFAGKDYEIELGKGEVPSDYRSYLILLRDVFAECLCKLEPGGRIAVNVANLGRRPYRSLAAEVIRILEDLGFLLRGEIVWVKARALGGSCTWGSFQSPANPVIRDTTERIVIASKGRFDRAVPRARRAKCNLPHVGTMTKEDFMEYTTDVWEIPAESASRVGHPAPFPVELPRRLIELYTYRGDVVLDPFLGSGTTALAAVQTGRQFAGFDLDPAYVALAHERLQGSDLTDWTGTGVALVPGGRHPKAFATVEDLMDAAADRGLRSAEIGEALLRLCGFEVEWKNRKLVAQGIDVDFVARTPGGRRVNVLLGGPNSGNRPGLKRTDVLWKVLGKAAVLSAVPEDERCPLLVLTTGLPRPGSPEAKALRNVTGPGRPIAAVIDMLVLMDAALLEQLARELS